MNSVTPVFPPCCVERFTPMPYLQLKSITKQFGETQVLKGISLDVEQGDFIVMVGASGCGKSTLLRCIAGLETPTAGEITLEGSPLLGKDPKDRDVAMVFQNYALYPHMSVYENMAFGLKMRNTPKSEIEVKVRETATLLGLDALMDRKPGHLSGGQCQRVALGRAIVRNPKLFLMDEPLSNLDTQLRQHMRHELKALHQRLGATTLYVTHDHTETLTLADKVVVLNKGHVAQFDTPEAVYHRPACTYVARFMAHMNLLHLAVDAATQTATLSTALRVEESPVTATATLQPKAVIARGLPLPARLLQALNSHQLTEVVLGVKPEHVSPTPHQHSGIAEADALQLPMHAVARELHGAYQTVRYATEAGSTEVDVVAHAPFSPSETSTSHHEAATPNALGCRFLWKDVSFFDANTSKAIQL
jgi:ABC-type sugar transport system ATPase subunit